MKIQIESTSETYTNFLSAEATVSIDNLANDFKFVSGIGKNINLGFGVGDGCSIYVADQRVLSGNIEIITGTGSSDASSIDISGRDKTGDIVDSSIGSLDDISSPISFKNVIERIIAHIGADIDVVDNTDPPEDSLFNPGIDLAAPEKGDNAFEYLEKLARHKRLLMSSDDEGRVIIQRNVGIDIDAHINNIKDGQSNNVLMYQFNFDHTTRFNRYESIGNSNAGLLKSILSIATTSEVVKKTGVHFDVRIREGRQHVIVSESPGTAIEQQERAQWEANIRKARSRTYNVTVAGHKNQTGDLWTPNTIVKVVDQNANINDRLLINSVTYKLDGTNGRTTAMTLINRDAYTIAEDEPQDLDAENPLDDALAKIKKAIRTVSERSSDET